MIGTAAQQYYILPPSRWIVLHFLFWDVPPIVYILKVVNFYNIKHLYTNYFLPLSPFYNNINTITPTTFLHSLKSIIKYIYRSHHYTHFSSNFTHFLHNFLISVCQPFVYKWLGRREYVISRFSIFFDCKVKYKNREQEHNLSNTYVFIDKSRGCYIFSGGLIINDLLTHIKWRQRGLDLTKVLFSLFVNAPLLGI